MLIKNFITLLLFVIILVSCNSSNKEPLDKEKLKAELSNHADEFTMGLKSVLMANMKAGGPLNAVNVCSDTASKLTDLYSDAMNIKVKRFSIKNRNLSNTPDSFEEEALNNFEKLHKENKLTKSSIVFEISENNAARIVKPILVGAPCLTCHGDNSQVSEEVSEILRKKYPEDKATGYKIGDLRGAISVTKSL